MYKQAAHKIDSTIEERIIEILINLCERAKVSVPDYELFSDEEYKKSFKQLPVGEYGVAFIPAGYCGHKKIGLNIRIFSKRQDCWERVLIHELAHHVVDKRKMERIDFYRDELGSLHAAMQKAYSSDLRDVHDMFFSKILFELYLLHDRNVTNTAELDGYSWSNQRLLRMKGTHIYKKFIKQRRKAKRSTA